MDTTLSIGEVAEQARLNISAIRFYERKGLLPEPERVSGQRRYSAETVQRLGTIDVAKQAGFSLEEIRVLLDSIDRGAPAHEQLQGARRAQTAGGRCPDRARPGDARLAYGRERLRLRLP